MAESPTRYRRALPSNIKLALSGSVLASLIGAIAITSAYKEGLPKRWEYQNITFNQIQYNFHEAFNVGTCFLDDRHQLEDLVNSDCLTPKPDKTRQNRTKPDKTNVLIIGDSFAAHLMLGLEHHFPNINFNQASACRSLVNFTRPNHDYGKWPCPGVNSLVFGPMIANQEYDIILLASDWQYGHDGKADGPNLLKTIKHIKSLTETPIVVLGNSQVYLNDSDIAVRTHSVTKHTVNSEIHLKPEVLKMDSFYKSNIKDAEFISLLDHYCTNDICPIITPEGKLVHFGTHLTEWEQQR